MRTPNFSHYALIAVALGLLGTPTWAQDDDTATAPAAEAQSDAETSDEQSEASVDADEANEEEVSKEVTWEQISIEHERIVRAYVEASVTIARAQAQLADALELKKQAAIARAEADALESDTTVDKKRLKAHTKTSKKTNELIQEKLDENEELTEEQRQEFTSGMVSYVGGVEQTHQVVQEAKPFVESVKSKSLSAAEKARNYGSVLREKPVAIFKRIRGREKSTDNAGENVGVGEMKTKLATGMYIGQNAPGLLASHGKTLGQVTKYMQDNDLAVPSEATQAMNRMQESDAPVGVF